MLDERLMDSSSKIMNIIRSIKIFLIFLKQEINLREINLYIYISYA